MTSHQIKSGALLHSIRFFLYVLSAAFYWAFMSSHAPLGIAWRPFHAQRVFNAVNHMVNGSPLLSYGFTSWNGLHEVAETISAGKPVETYLVSPLPHLLQSALVSINPAVNLSHIGVIGDYCLICGVAALSAEIIFKVINPSEPILAFFWPVSGFALFLASPWSYRMMLAPWHEVSWLFFYLLAALFFLLNRKYIGLVSLTIAGFYQWQWSFFLFIFYAIAYFVDLMQDGKTVQFLLPPGLCVRPGLFMLMSATIVPAIFHYTQGLIILSSKLNLKHNGSNLLFRIGIDGLANSHHGGILAAMQFLGGNRASLCLQAENGLALSNVIAKFNCILSILGVVVLSLAGLIGYLWICSSDKNLRWLTLPTLWSFSAFGLIFQQSYAVHLQGYSFIFAFIFALGLSFLLHKFCGFIRLPSALVVTCCAPLIAGTLINFVRVNYITGFNG